MESAFHFEMNVSNFCHYFDFLPPVTISILFFSIPSNLSLSFLSIPQTRSLPTPSLIKANGPLEIPEILGLIARYLSVKDLARCAQVSRFWNTVFHPRKWHTFDDSIEPWSTILEMASRTSLDTIDFVKTR